MADEHPDTASIAASIVMGIVAVGSGLGALLLGRASIPRWQAGDLGTAGLYLIGTALMMIIALSMLLLLRAMIKHNREQREIARRRSVHPDEPWLWLSAWDGGRVESNREASSALVLILFAVFWNAMTLIAAVSAHERYGLLKEPAVGISIGVFMAAGIFLAGLAIYILARALKYPPAVLKMDATPGVLGGRLSGMITIPENVPSGAESVVSLECNRVTGSGKNRTHHVDWHDEQRVVQTVARIVFFEFSIPYELPETSRPGDMTGPSVDWQVVLAAKTPGVDYVARFDLPVFKTSASDPNLKIGAIPRDAKRARPRQARARVLDTGGDRSVVVFPFPKWLPIWTAIALFVPLLAFPLRRVADLDQEGFLLALGVGVLIGGGLLALMLLAVLITPTRITIDGRAVSVRRGHGWLSWTRTIPLHQVAEVRFTSTGNPASQTISAFTADGRSYQIALDMSGLDEAKWLTAEITRLIESHRGSRIGETG